LKAKNNKMKLYIRTWFVVVVKWQLKLEKKMGLSILAIQLGEVEIATDLDESNATAVKTTCLVLNVR
jgi:hypothetical protein